MPEAAAPIPALDSDSAIPYARSVVVLSPRDWDAIRRTVATLFHVAHREAFQCRADAEPDAGPVARHRPPYHAVLMGYDFHLGLDGPRLIEINTNAGGALLNGAYTAEICSAAAAAGRCTDVLPVQTLRERLLATFLAELAAARPGARLGRVAIADDRPETQFLRGEFELFRQLFTEAGAEAVVCDVADLERAPGGGLRVRGSRAPLDLVY
ncbi:MAG TPA: hypothetical protein VIN04_05985, partial [Myxococcota bacterium]